MYKTLTKTELEIMHYIWSLGQEVTATDVRLHFSNKQWTKQAVSFFLRQLVNYNFLNVRKTATNKYFYRATITEWEYSKTIFKNAINNGELVGLIPSNITKDDIVALEQLLIQLKKENNID